MKEVVILRKYEFEDVWERLCDVYGVDSSEEFIITYTEY